MNNNNQNNNNNNNQNNQNTNNNNANPPQNNQQGGLLNRVNNQNQNNLNNASQNQNQNNNNNNNTLRSRFGNNNRFGNNQPQKPTWTITPMGDGVRIAYQGIGDPLFRILGTLLDTSMTQIDELASKLAEDDDLLQDLIDKLDEAWDTYNISGAIMMHPVRRNIQEAFTLGVMPIAQNNQQNNNQSDNNNNASLPAPQPVQPTPPTPYKAYRAVDAMFVLNILGRVRGSILVDETPIALEAGFLNQSYICDDPRVVEMAIATGAVEETW